MKFVLQHDIRKPLSVDDSIFFLFYRIILIYKRCPICQIKIPFSKAIKIFGQVMFGLSDVLRDICVVKE